jgi:hypothetical protein
MADDTSDDVVPIDRDARSILEEFSRDPIAMAAEIARLRAELADLRLDAERPPVEIIVRQPERPPDAPPPARFARAVHSHMERFLDTYCR